MTKNLYSALLRLRHSETDRTLWVDALCINQSDLDEKGQQVSLMREIFKRAGKVTMWLGEPEMEEPPLKLEPESQTVTLGFKPFRTTATLREDHSFPKHHQRQVPVSQELVPPPMAQNARIHGGNSNSK
jgi:hypothetical protein